MQERRQSRSSHTIRSQGNWWSTIPGFAAHAAPTRAPRLCVICGSDVSREAHTLSDRRETACQPFPASRLTPLPQGHPAFVFFVGAMSVAKLTRHPITGQLLANDCRLRGLRRSHKAVPCQNDACTAASQRVPAAFSPNRSRAFRSVKCPLRRNSTGAATAQIALTWPCA